jgi:hypothetical protein
MTTSQCRNCSAPLEGEYCSQCGQREGRSDVQLSDVAGELADDFIHLDSRIWRTLRALLFRPGFLTAEFMAGRKARYVPAFRLYLIISFVLFLMLSLESATGGLNAFVSIDGELPATSSDAESAPEQSGPLTEEGESLSIGFDLRSQRPQDVESSTAAGNSAIAPNVISKEDRVVLDEEITIGLADEDSAQWLKDLDQRLDENLKRLAQDPSEFVGTLIEYLPQTMFVLLPLFALFIKLCYLFSPFHYLQHLVFSLHYHSFIYLLLLIASLGELVLSVEIGGIVFVLLILYLPLSLRRAYGSNWPGAIGKAAFVIAADSVLLVIGLAVAALIALTLM